MKLEAGKYYEAANGEVFGPMREDPEVPGIWDAGEDHFLTTTLHWHEDGLVGRALILFGKYTPKYSLVKEVEKPTTH